MDDPHGVDAAREHEGKPVIDRHAFSYQIGTTRTAATEPTSEIMLKATGVMALFGIVVIHFVQLIPTFEAMPLLGFAYLGLIGATIVVGFRLVRGGSTATRLWAPVGILGVAALVGYAFTRAFSTPLDSQDVGNWACTLGMAALVVEGLLVALSVHAIVRATTPPPRREYPVDTAWMPDPADMPAEQIDLISSWLVATGPTAIGMPNEWDSDPAA